MCGSDQEGGDQHGGRAVDLSLERALKVAAEACFFGDGRDQSGHPENRDHGDYRIIGEIRNWVARGLHHLKEHDPKPTKETIDNSPASRAIAKVWAGTRVAGDGLTFIIAGGVFWYYLLWLEKPAGRRSE